jgi:hypothetical protein
MSTIRNTLASLLLAVAGWLSAPLAAPAIDAEPARCAAAVAVAYAALAGDAPAPVPPPAPPTPPAPEAPCGKTCSNGVYKPDGRIPMQCPSDCPCGCRRPKAAVKCQSCLDTRSVMGADGVIRPCRVCSCASGSCPTR